MIVKSIDFKYVKQIIEKIFSVEEAIDNWHLIPNDISRIALKSGKVLKWQSIPKWDLFETGDLEIPDKEFLQFLFHSSPISDMPVIIITDECFAQKKGFLLNFKDIEQFISKEYPDSYEMDFFQPFDYIFVFPNLQKLVLLHHEGVFTTYQHK